MRAVKSVLLASASLRRLYTDLPEPEIVLRAIVDVNLPKFLEQDISLFIGIYMDLFPGVELPMVRGRSSVQIIYHSPGVMTRNWRQLMR